MKRDWDLIRDILIEVEALETAKHETITFGPASGAENSARAEHGVMLWQAGYIRGADATTYDGHAVLAQGLTWEGHDLLDTIRSKAIWERIKATASEKGIELTVDAVKALGKAALAWAVGG